jgi:excisionase family DNA binding protein
MAENLYTVTEASDYLKVNPQTVRQLYRTNQLAATRIGTKIVRFTQAELDRFVAAHTEVASAASSNLCAH